MGEKLPDWKAAADLVRKISANYKLPYYTLSPVYSVCRKHGYIAGEEWKCPICGDDTEVYSRITGYYRPVQNWNVGKTQEYKERKAYNIEKSMARVDGVEIPEEQPCVCEEQPVAQAAPQGTAVLFATATCPNCKIAAALLEKAGVGFEKLLAEENAELATELGIKQAPTLVITTDEGEVTKYVGVGSIRKYIDMVK